jgi:hypothetical protein
MSDAMNEGQAVNVDALERLSFFDKIRADKDLNKGWVDEDGCHWDGLVEYVQGYVLGFCCCGLPTENLNYVLAALSYIDERRSKNIDQAVFGNEQSMYFFFYWAHQQELTEHGSSVPGWLTDKGKTLLADLRILKEAGELLG